MLDHDPIIAAQQFSVGSSVATMLGQAVCSVDVILNPRSRNRKLRTAVHDLRVALRRLHVVADALSAMLPANIAGKLKRRTKRLRQSAGVLRDIDVQHEVLVELRRESAGDDVGVALLLSDLKKKRRRLLARLRRRLRRRKCRRLWTWIAEEVVPKLDAANCSIAELRSIATREVGARLIEFKDAQIAAADRTTEHLHKLRISAKRLRYTIELFDSCGVKVAGSEIHNEVKTLQDTLGRLQDLAVLMEHCRAVAAKAKWTKAERLALMQVTQAGLLNCCWRGFFPGILRS